MGEKAEARFNREIQALGRVDHRHVVKVFTSGSEGEFWFYAMELVEGVPLSMVCERLQAKTTSAAQVDLQTWQGALSTACAESRKSEKPLSSPPAPPRAVPIVSPEADHSPPLPGGRDYVRQIVRLIAQAAEGAHALHEANVIHRDIKPGNIMVTADGKQAMLLDLGVAQLADDLGRQADADAASRRHAAVRQPAASAGGGQARPADRHLQPGGDAVGTAHVACLLGRHR